MSDVSITERIDGGQSGKIPDNLNRTIKEGEIGKRTEIPVPSSEQMTALWLSLHNISKEPSLKSFFDENKPFPVNKGNYDSYSKTFTEYFDAMRQVLDGKNLSDIEFPEISDEKPTPQSPLMHEVDSYSLQKK